MDITFPEPNPALTEILIGAQMRRIVEERATTAAMLFQAEVAKRTGHLAASAHASTEIGGVRKDRWIGTLTVGGNGVAYGASVEFGHHQKPSDEPEYVHGRHDLNRVLEELGGI